ncbi:GLPGLI family protein [Porphyromonas cangingivalis]|uniref:GLPGLI family protein n=1 Tax=Porphyromonas cangingivalis TaxID=36874 RepID=UPI000D9E449F|nr:GLPGLI family protein [Porphyromonas cangingivalis]SPY35771.1 GLPGLI family protein [Porphyromonas cangingivalis]
MKTKRTTIFLALMLVCLTSGTATAQKPPGSVFKAIYEMKGSYMAEDLNNKDAIPKYLTVLEIYPDKSFFYHLQRVYNDSIIQATLQATNDPVGAQMAGTGINSKTVVIHVLSSFETGKRTVTHPLYFDHYRYEEGMTRPEWVIDESVTETKSGYKCHKATADYLGRVWTVWYTPEIPTSAGPWKLWGLPGLIVEASEADGMYAFSMSSFTSMDEKDSKIGCEKYLALGNLNMESRKNVMKLVKLYVTDKQAFFLTIFPGSIVDMGSKDGSPVRAEEMRRKFVDIER